MPNVIIICGLPGSGKTTLAQALSKELNMACLHKDVLKESLYTLLNMSTLKDSKRIGQLSIKLMLELAERMIANSIDIMIESPFMYLDDYKILEKWITEHKTSLTHIICSLPAEERYQRFTTRPRHEAHHDEERNLSKFTEQDESIYESLPGKKIKIITNRPINELIEEVITQL